MGLQTITVPDTKCLSCKKPAELDASRTHGIGGRYQAPPGFFTLELHERKVSAYVCTQCYSDWPICFVPKGT